MVYNAQEIFSALKDKSLVIEGCKNEIPFEDSQVQAASIDLRLDNRIVRFLPDIDTIDTKKNADPAYLLDKMEEIYLEKDQPLEIKPHEVVFGQIYEGVALSEDMTGRIEGRSRTARLGLSVHCTGSHINPGFTGIIPLQITNHNNFSIIIYPYMQICQLILYHLNEAPIIKYGMNNQYQHEKKAGPSVLTPSEPDIVSKIYDEQIKKIKDQYYEKHKTESNDQSNTTIEEPVITSLKSLLSNNLGYLFTYENKLAVNIAEMEHEAVNPVQFITALKKCKILLLTANKVEDTMITQLFYRANECQQLLKCTIEGFRIQLGTICGIKTAHVVQHHMGSSSTMGSEETVNTMLKYFQPLLIISIGVAYGIDPQKQSIGDVLLSQKIIDIDLCHKLTNGKYKFYPISIISVGEQIHASWEHLLNNQEYMKLYKCHYGTMFSKGTVLSDTEEKHRLLEAAHELDDKDDIIGGEMEGAGVFRACINHSNSFDCIVIKGICDWGEYKNALGDLAEKLKITYSNDQLKDWMQAFATENAFYALQNLLQKAPSVIAKNKIRNHHRKGLLWKIKQYIQGKKQN